MVMYSVCFRIANVMTCWFGKKNIFNSEIGRRGIWSPTYFVAENQRVCSQSTDPPLGGKSATAGGFSYWLLAAWDMTRPFEGDAKRLVSIQRCQRVHMHRHWYGYESQACHFLHRGYWSGGLGLHRSCVVRARITKLCMRVSLQDTRAVHNMFHPRARFRHMTRQSKAHV